MNKTTRLRPSSVVRSSADLRSPYESDYDRVLFSSAFRRLQDKTQVFPLERHDFVRTRLTHSMEVSTIGRDLGISVAKVLLARDLDRSLRPEDAGTIIATACLLHDIGNPPFGHSGEQSIGKWFKLRIGEGKLTITDPQERRDLETFEGNASGFRIATRLQHLGEPFGMNLTAGALACLMKYPCASHEVDETKQSKRRAKFGYFKADRYAFQRVQALTHLNGTRHPLTFLMEAADDIVYSAVDIEDALKKGILSHQIIVDFLTDRLKDCPKGKELLDTHLKDRQVTLREGGHTSKEADQLAYQYFRNMVVGQMASSCVEHFVTNYEPIMAGHYDRGLTETSVEGQMELTPLCDALQALARESVYAQRDIVAIEFAGRRILHGLLDIFLEELGDWKKDRSKLMKSLLPRAMQNEGDDSVSLSDDYRYLLRAADYVAGMTDSFARDLHHRLTGQQ